MMREFATISEIAALGLPQVPTAVPLYTRAKKNQWNRPEWKDRFWRPCEASGGGIEYSYRLLPKQAQLAWVRRFLECNEEQPETVGQHAAAWDAYHSASDWQKGKALNDLKTLEMVERLCSAGWTVSEAAAEVVDETGRKVSVRKVMRLRAAVRGIQRQHWLAYLVPGRSGPKSARTACSEDAWEFIKADWLRPEKPTVSACYRRLNMAAIEHGWTIPSEKTIGRWLSDLPVEVVTLAREGKDAIRHLIPAQDRDRTHFHALQAVNSDGHKWDVWVQWPDGTIARPLMVAWQDLYSNMILSWRVDRSENKDTIQLALGDFVEKYGIPERAYLDNGKAFASKQLTGGSKNRNRFKYRDGDPSGVLTILGVETIFVRPYSGQSKPIERSFRDLAGDLAKHPSFAGAYTGNSPVNKPANYGEKAVPLAKFLSVISAGIEEWNSRPGRRTAVCKGVKSFRQVFEESLSQCAVRKPTPEQRHLWLRAAENVVASKRDGTVRFLGNRYYADFMREHMGQRLVIRFDPQDLHTDLHIYNAQGEFLGDAPVIEKTGFDSTAAAARTKKAERQLNKLAREKLELERKFNPSELAAMLPDELDDGEELIEQKVVSPFRPGGVVTNAQNPAPAQFDDDGNDEITTAAIINFMRQSA